MLTTTASRTLSRVAVQRMAAGRAQRTYAVAGGPVNETKPGARPGDVSDMAIGMQECARLIELV